MEKSVGYIGFDRFFFSPSSYPFGATVAARDSDVFRLRRLFLSVNVGHRSLPAGKLISIS